MTEPRHEPLTGIGASHILSHKVGGAIVVALLVQMGAMCPKCGHGTRVTSKRWARCKKCGERVGRVGEPR